MSITKYNGAKENSLLCESMDPYCRVFSRLEWYLSKKVIFLVRRILWLLILAYTRSEPRNKILIKENKNLSDVFNSWRQIRYLYWDTEKLTKFLSSSASLLHRFEGAIGKQLIGHIMAENQSKREKQKANLKLASWC